MPRQEDGSLSNVSKVTVDVFVRHTADCRCPCRTDKEKSRHCRRCKCPKHLYIYANGEEERRSAKTRSWEVAERLRREIEDSYDPVKAELKRLQAKRTTISDAIELYLSDVEVRNLAPKTLRRCRRIFGENLLSWCERKRLQFILDLTTARLTEWRSTWGLAPITMQTQQQRVANFFVFCVSQGWLDHNPACLLSRIHVEHRPTDYFKREEFEKLIEATRSFGIGSGSSDKVSWRIRVRTMLLLLRWSGLRLGDAVTLERSRLDGNNLLLRQAKTGVSVFVPLPPDVAEALREIPPGREPNARYFFWSGTSSVRTAVCEWSRTFRRLFKNADIRNLNDTPKRCHPQMLRDTFAVENLSAGIPLDQVSILLGHSSIKTTERHMRLGSSLANNSWNEV